MRDLSIPTLTSLALDRCFSRVDALAGGVSDEVLAGLVARKFISAVFPGVYVVGAPALTHREFLRACVLHAGPYAYPSHRSGLELRGLIDVRRGLATVTTKRRNLNARIRSRVPLVDGGFGLLRVRRSTPTLELPTESVDGFETTLLPRTLVDAAAQDGRAVLKAAWEKAAYRALLDVEAIEAEVRDHPRAGARAVRERLRHARPVTRPGDDLRSVTGELRFLELIEGSGLPRPEINVPLDLDGEIYVGDFLFRNVGLVVETDGPDHLRPEQVLSDKARDAAFLAAGLVVLRLPNDRMAADPDGSLASVLAVYDRRLRDAGLRDAGLRDAGLRDTGLRDAA